jgi:hypothetical protein
MSLSHLPYELLGPILANIFPCRGSDREGAEPWLGKGVTSSSAGTISKHPSTLAYIMLDLSLASCKFLWHQ